MAPHQKKPPVTPDDRQKWLERLEHGETPPQIAAAYGVDPRTVRKHIEVARHEKEVKEVRYGVLRNKLESHYDDLCRYAERLGEDIRGKKVSLDTIRRNTNEISPYEVELAVALRQHIPRSAIWKLLNQRTKLRTDITELTKELEKKIELAISSDSNLISELTNEENGVIPGIVAALKGQSQHWVSSWATLNVKDNLKAKRIDDEFDELSYGGYGLGKVRRKHIELIGDAITNWTERFRESVELKELEKLILEMERLQNQLRKEIAVIVLRRVVPGRCLYCPL